MPCVYCSLLSLLIALNFISLVKLIVMFCFNNTVISLNYEFLYYNN